MTAPAKTQRANRAILLTPSGAAAIAVVRITGGGVREFLSAHFAQPVSESRCVHGELSEGNQVIDDPVIVLLPDDRGADINLHGGPWVVQACLDLLRKDGFEIDSTMSPETLDGGGVLVNEMLAHLPRATTEPALRALLAQPAAWEKFVAGGPSREAIRAVESDRSLWWMLNPPRVAIVGAPNVGKSTLANQLFAQQRSIAADLPGTTRDWVGEIANLDGLAVMLVDTPGVREADDPIEQAAIDRASVVVSGADLVIVVLDATNSLISQSTLVDRYPAAIHVANKTDVTPREEVLSIAHVRTIATRGEGIDDLRRVIRARFNCNSIDPAQPRWWTDRQREILRSAMTDVQMLQRMMS